MTKIKHLPFLAVFSRYGKLLVSPDPTLKKGTFSSCRNSTAIYKNQRRGSQSPRFKITILKTGEEPPTNRNTPSLAQQLESKHRFIISHFIQIQTFFHSHPPIHLSNKHCILAHTVYENLEKNQIPGQTFLPWGPGAQWTNKKGHDLILTHTNRHWESEWPSKALSLPQDQTARKREAISILAKSRRNEVFHGPALTHWSTAGRGHQTQALSDRKLCCPQKKTNLTVWGYLSRALHHPYLGFINNPQEIGKCQQMPPEGISGPQVLRVKSQFGVQLPKLPKLLFITIFFNWSWKSEVGRVNALEYFPVSKFHLS